MSETQIPDASGESPSADNPRIEVHGDPEGGFFVSIHDGDALRNFAVEFAQDAQDAKMQAIKRWRALVAKAKELSAPVSADLSNAAEALKGDLAQAANDLRSQLTQHHNSLASGLRNDATMLWNQVKVDFEAMVAKAKAEYAALTAPRDTSLVGGDRGQAGEPSDQGASS